MHANRATGTMRSGSGRGDRRRRNIAGGEAGSTGTGECYGTGEAVQGRKLLVAVAITPREKRKHGSKDRQLHAGGRAVARRADGQREKVGWPVSWV